MSVQAGRIVDRFGVNTSASGGARGSQVVCAGELVMFAAIPRKPFDPSEGMAEQTKQVLESVEHRLKLAGSSKENILSVQIMISDRGHLAAMNAVWDAWVSQTSPPVRFCSICGLASEEALVEMVVTAIRASVEDDAGGQT